MKKRWILAIVVCCGLVAVGSILAKSSKASAKLALTITSSTDIITLGFSPNNRLLAISDMQNPVKIRDVTTGKIVSQLKNSQHVLGVTFFPQGKTAVSFGEKGTVTLWNVSTGNQTISFKGHQHLVPERDFTYDAGSGKTTRKPLKHKVPAGISVIAIPPDEKLLVTGSDDETIEVWRITSHKRLRVFKGHKSPISTLTFSKNSKLIASIDESGIAKLWNVNSGQVIGTLKGVSEQIGVRWSADNSELIIFGADGKISTWDVKTCRRIKIKDTGCGQVTPVEDIGYSTDWSRLSICQPDDSDGYAAIYDTNKQTNTCLFAIAKPNATAMSSDGKVLAVGGTEYSQKVKNGYRKVIQIWSLP